MLTPWFKKLVTLVNLYGGFCNAHLHLDRTDTLKNDDWDLSLKEKQQKIERINGPESFRRITRTAAIYLTWFKQNGYRSAYTCVDTSPQIGSLFFDALVFARDMVNFDLKIAAYSPGGLDTTEKRQAFEKILPQADFICTLPERDSDFIKHCDYVFDQATIADKDVQMHIDQENTPRGRDLETLCSYLGQNNFGGRVWAVHAISMGCYSEIRFENLVNDLLKTNVGVICCPSAALGMAQDRSWYAPIHNSITRVKELYMAGVPVRLGSDNICDMFSPTSTPDLLQEIMLASNAVRYYDVEAWARMASETM